MKKIHSNAENPYPVFAAHVAELAEVFRLDFPSKYFTLLLCADFQNSPVKEIAELAARLMNSGNVYFCAWGPACEKAHDIYDEEIVHRDLEGRLAYHVDTTWHDDEPIEEALWFVLFTAMVADEHWEKCSTVVVSVGNEGWRDRLEEDLHDIAAFNDRLVESEA